MRTFRTIPVPERPLESAELYFSSRCECELPSAVDKDTAEREKRSDPVDSSTDDFDEEDDYSNMNFFDVDSGEDDGAGGVLAQRKTAPTEPEDEDFDGSGDAEESIGSGSGTFTKAYTVKRKII